MLWCLTPLLTIVHPYLSITGMFSPLSRSTPQSGLFIIQMLKFHKNMVLVVSYLKFGVYIKGRENKSEIKIYDYQIRIYIII